MKLNLKKIVISSALLFSITTGVSAFADGTNNLSNEYQKPEQKLRKYFGKIAFIGDVNSDKTELLNALLPNRQVQRSYDAAKIDVVTRINKEIDGKNITLDIQDISSSERYWNQSPNFVNSADLVVINIDLSNILSLDHIKNITEKVRKINTNAKILVLGTNLENAQIRSWDIDLAIREIHDSKIKGPLIPICNDTNFILDSVLRTIANNINEISVEEQPKDITPAPAVEASKPVAPIKTSKPVAPIKTPKPVAPVAPALLTKYFGKIAFIGDINSGKTELLNALLPNREVQRSHDAAKIDVATRINKEIDGKNITLDIQDISPSERYWNQSPNFVNNADLVVINIDLSDVFSLGHIENVTKKIRKINTNAKILVVGTNSNSENTEIQPWDIYLAIREINDSKIVNPLILTSTNTENDLNSIIRAIANNINEISVEEQPKDITPAPEGFLSKIKSWFCW